MSFVGWIIGIGVVAIIILIVVWLYKELQKDKKKQDPRSFDWSLVNTLDRLFAPKYDSRPKLRGSAPSWLSKDAYR